MADRCRRCQRRRTAAARAPPPGRRDRAGARGGRVRADAARKRSQAARRGRVGEDSAGRRRQVRQSPDRQGQGRRAESGARRRRAAKARTAREGEAPPTTAKPDPRRASRPASRRRTRAGPKRRRDAPTAARRRSAEGAHRRPAKKPIAEAEQNDAGRAAKAAAASPASPRRPRIACPRRAASAPRRTCRRRRKATPPAGFSVQLAAFADDKGANALANKLKKRAAIPRTPSRSTTSKGTLWRVRVGPYPVARRGGGVARQAEGRGLQRHRRAVAKDAPTADDRVRLVAIIARGRAVDAVRLRSRRHARVDRAARVGAGLRRRGRVVAAGGRMAARIRRRSGGALPDRVRGDPHRGARRWARLSRGRCAASSARPGWASSTASWARCSASRAGSCW